MSSCCPPTQTSPCVTPSCHSPTKPFNSRPKSTAHSHTDPPSLPQPFTAVPPSPSLLSLHWTTHWGVASPYLPLPVSFPFDFPSVGVEALALSSSHVKALYRRGAAYRLTGALDLSRADLVKAQQLAPQDAAIKAELQLLSQAERRQETAAERAVQGPLHINHSTTATPHPIVYTALHCTTQYTAATPLLLHCTAQSVVRQCGRCGRGGFYTVPAMLRCTECTTALLAPCLGLPSFSLLFHCILCDEWMECAD